MTLLGTRAFGLAAVAAAACAAPPAWEPAQPSPTGEAPRAKSSAPTLTSSVPLGETSAPATRPPPSLGRDHRSAVPCATDADCGWDDTCFPKRCVEPSARTACDESGPPPGDCLCVEGACTAKPKTAPTSTGACEPRGCVVDRAAGVCVADTNGVTENIRTNPGLSVGPSCDCVSPKDGCAFQWFDPIPCKSERDCWVDASPRRHPVVRPKALRGRDFKPCSDGEVAPKCNDQGFCALGPAYRC